jgi:hypothetical protein
MKRVIRSVLDISDASGFPTIPLDDLKKNFSVLREAKISFDLEEDRNLFSFVSSYFFTFRACPSYNSVMDHFIEKDVQSVLDRLSEIKIVKPYIKTDFEHLLRGLIEKQREVKCQEVLHTAAEILHTGTTTKTKRGDVYRKGVRDAISHVIKESDDLIVPEFGYERLKGDIRGESGEVYADYIKAKEDPSRGAGRFTGFTNIDTVIKGLRPGRLWLHAGFTGGLKSTFAVNWAYNNCVRYGWNSYFLSLEMTRTQLRLLTFCLHTANKKFLALGYKPIDYNKAVTGALTEEEEDFFFNVAGKDFDTNPSYGRFYIERPIDKVTMPEIKSKMEMLHTQEMPVHLAFIDHATLVTPTMRTGDYGVAMNSIMIEAKQLALNFNNGEGVPLCLLFQINRKGKQEADKNEGRHEAHHLYYANEAEKSSDIITYTYINDDLKRENEVKIGCMKNREGISFDQFKAKVIWECLRVCNLDIGDLGSQAANIEVEVLKQLG